MPFAIDQLNMLVLIAFQVFVFCSACIRPGACSGEYHRTIAESMREMLGNTRVHTDRPHLNGGGIGHVVLHLLYSRLGEMANLIICGGPQARASVSSPPSVNMLL